MAVITSITVVSETVLALSWSHMQDEIVQQESYTFGIDLTPISPCMGATLPTISVSGSTFSTTVSNLSPGTTYSVVVSVSAQSGSCLKSQSDPVSAKTIERLPLPPTNTSAVAVSSSSIEFRWSPPACNSRNGDITSYVVRLTRLPNQLRANPLVAVTDRNITIYMDDPSNSTTWLRLIVSTVLEASIQYQMSVTATNSIGTSAPTAPIVLAALEAGTSPSMCCGTRTICDVCFSSFIARS